MAQTPPHYVWKEGNWGQIVVDQNDSPHWIAIETSDFVTSPRPAATPNTKPPTTQLAATDDFYFTPRHHQNKAQSLQYTTTLPYSKGTQLRAGVQYAQRQSSPLKQAQDASLGVQLYNGKFQISSLYLQRAQQNDYRNTTDSSSYNFQIYNVTASYQLTPRVRLGLGYNRGAINQEGRDAIDLSRHNYENVILGATTQLSLMGTGVNLGYFYQRGGDESRNSSGLDGDDYTGVLFNLNF